MARARAHDDEPIIPAIAAEHVLRWLTKLELDADAVAERFGRERLRQRGERVSPAYMRELWNTIGDVTREVGIGVRIAEQLQVERFGLLGDLWASSATVGESLLLASRLLRVVVVGLRIAVNVDGTQASLVIESSGTPLHREVVELALAATVVLGRHLTGRDISPLEVTFAHEAPRDLRHHQRVFRAPLQFGRAQNATFFDSALLQLPIVSSDAVRKLELAAEAERHLRESEETADVEHQVREEISLALGSGDASSERVAARLGLHPKTLRRRLAQLGTSYGVLLERVRLEMAERYLRRPELSVEQVALNLGYSEKSAFNRAFKRWSGESPIEYRRSLRRS